VGADLRVRPASAQPRDDACLIGGELELERHTNIVGTDAESLAKIGSAPGQDPVKGS
jgi:hypothetical protein